MDYVFENMDGGYKVFDDGVVQAVVLAGRPKGPGHAMLYLSNQNEHNAVECCRNLASPVEQAFLMVNIFRFDEMEGPVKTLTMVL